jgi:peptidoglycan glycosyltransferase
MARVAAALGSDGVIREAPLVGAAGTTVSTQFVPAAAAGILASAMREAVTAGTGRQLAGHPGRIAGKTGTAEVDKFDPHAWFVGFAPYGSATKRIAFAVVLEHAGYGGATAAAATGQIVTAATMLGLVR